MSGLARDCVKWCGKVYVLDGGSYFVEGEGETVAGGCVDVGYFEISISALLKDSILRIFRFVGRWGRMDPATSDLARGSEFTEWYLSGYVIIPGSKNKGRNSKSWSKGVRLSGKS